MLHSLALWIYDSARVAVVKAEAQAARAEEEALLREKAALGRTPMERTFAKLELENKAMETAEAAAAARMAYVKSLMEGGAEGAEGAAEAPARPKSSWEIQKEKEEAEAEVRRKQVRAAALPLSH
eukprot:734944-Prorocentrum_minimum.AAC.1